MGRRLSILSISESVEVRPFPLSPLTRSFMRMLGLLEAWEVGGGVLPVASRRRWGLQNAILLCRARCNRVGHQGWWVLATGAKRNCGLPHNDTRSGERLDGEAAWRSRAVGEGARKRKGLEERL